MLQQVRSAWYRWAPWPGRVLGGLILLVVGVFCGIAVVRYGLVGPLGLLLGLGLALAAVLYPQLGLLLAIAVAVLLPFGVLPLRLGLTPSFLEMTLLGFLFGWLLPPLLRGGRRWRFSWLDGLLWALIAVVLFSLVLGLGRGVDSSLLHGAFKFLLGMIAFYGVRQVWTKQEDGCRFLAVLLLAAGLAALIGLFFYALPDRLALDVLVRLGAVGYPTEGRVLRYVEDDPEGLERAIGTSVDPNSFGGMLALVGAVAAGEVLLGRPFSALFGDRRPRQEQAAPVLPLPLLLAILGLILLCLFLTYSRAALGGFVAAGLFLAAVRYRRLWWLILAGALLLAVLVVGLGKGGAVLERFRQGLLFQDQANQMRLDEYANALNIIRRYPIFGVGLGSAPDVDLSTGVSSLYLTIAEHLGLVGLAAFGACVGAAFWRALRPASERTSAGMALASGHRLALLAGVVAALTIGLLDHYFFNLDFPHMAALFWSVLGAATADYLS